MSWSDQAKVYRGRTPDESPLWQLLDEHFDEFEELYNEFEERYDELFARQYGFYRPVISHVIRIVP